MVYPLGLLDFDEVRVLRVSLRQRRRARRGQRVDAAALVHLVSGHVGVVPSSLAHRHHAGHDARRDLRHDLDGTAIIEHLNLVAIFNAALAGVQRVRSTALAGSPA